MQQEKLSLSGRETVLWIGHGPAEGYYPLPLVLRRAEVNELVGAWSEAEHDLREAVVRADRAAVEQARIESRQRLSFLLQSKGDNREARATAAEALELSLAIGDEILTAESQAALSGVLSRLTEYEQALAHSRQALETFRRLNHQRGVSRALNNMGVILSGTGEYQQALECYRERLVIDETLGDRKGLSNTYNNIGACHLYLGDRRAARENFTRKLEFDRRIGHKMGIAVALCNIGHLNQLDGRLDEAGRCFEQSMEIYRGLGDKRGSCIVINNIGTVHDARGEYDRSLERYRQALALAGETGDKKGEAIYHCNIALCHFHLKDLEEALRWYRSGIDQLIALRQYYDACYHFLDQAEVLRQLGRPGEAKAAAEQGIGLASLAGREDVRFDLQVQLASITGKTDAAAAEKQLILLLTEHVQGSRQATVNHELFRLTHDQRYRERAAALYRGLIEETGKDEYRKELERLESERSGTVTSEHNVVS
jgi:tetratricopeptide (TPR) repeat protein